MFKFTAIIQDAWRPYRVACFHVEVLDRDADDAKKTAQRAAWQAWSVSMERVHVLAVVEGHVECCFIENRDA